MASIAAGSVRLNVWGIVVYGRMLAPPASVFHEDRGDRTRVVGVVSDTYAAVSVLSGVVTALCVAGEAAVGHSNMARLRSIVPAETVERVTRRLADRDRILMALLNAKILGTALFFMSFTLWQVGRGEGEPSAGQFLGAFGLALLVMLVLVNILVRYLVRAVAAPALVLLYPFIRLVDLVFLPVTHALRFLVAACSRLFGVAEKPAEISETRADILSAVLEGEREGLIHKEEKAWIESIISIKDQIVREVMTPRTTMVCAEAGLSIDEIVDLARREGYSRIPVYKGNRDNIIGVLHVRDLLTFWNGARPAGGSGIEKVLRPPIYVPETKKIADLLTELRRQKTHLAIVLDEYGGTSGLVTLEDILEEIVGEIHDEHDTVAEPSVRRLNDSEADVDATVHVHELNTAMGLAIPEGEDYETVGGYLTTTFGKVPRKGEILRQDGLEFAILDSDERKIRRVRVRVAAQPQNT